MTKNQNVSDSKNSSLSNKTFKKTSRKKTSVEDLADEGYTIGRVLGEGSYCKVKSAIFEGREIAVKILTRQQLSTDFETKFLPRELDILTRVRHPNIVHVYKIYKYPRRIYIFMELIGKGDLLYYVRKRGRLMEFEAKKFFNQMVNAILYLHSLNIAHRDLKCENIMINDNDEIKIIDFGFCRCTVNAEGRRELSRTFCGSTAYAAPEILQGIPYNPMMYDVWSLGCVLYIMVTGSMPFDDSNRRKLVNCQLEKKFKYPPTVNVTKPIKDLISCMLEPDVTKRANMYQVSKCSWLKQKATDSQQCSSVDKGDVPDFHRTSSTSIGIQTDI